MKISVLVSDLTDNPIVRAYPILKVLEKTYEIDVIGPCFGNHLFGAYKEEFRFRVIEGCSYPKFLKRLREMYNSVNGDVLFAFKPRPSSYLIGLICSLLKRIPMVLDIEDWELAPYFAQRGELSRWGFFNRYIVHGWKIPNDFKYLYLAEKLVSLSDAIFVASDFLKRKYGGIKLYHGVDTKVFNPRKFDKQLLRKKWNVAKDRKVVLFAGTPRPHKGLDDLIRALNIIPPNGKVNLLIVGGTIEGSIDSYLYKSNRERIISLGYQPHALMPELLHLSDIIVLPQKDTLISKAQVPAKVFEAMAMAKPIISTAVSDLPQILEGCGAIVQPGDIEDLAKKIQYVLENPKISMMMGKRAREKCIKLYSYEAMGKILIPIFEKFEKRCHS